MKVIMRRTDPVDGVGYEGGIGETNVQRVLLRRVKPVPVPDGAS